MLISPELYDIVPSTNAACVPSNPFTLKQYPFKKKCEGRSIDTIFESNVSFLTKELLQPSCFEPYSIWQNLANVC